MAANDRRFGRKSIFRRESCTIWPVSLLKFFDDKLQNSLQIQLVRDGVGRGGVGVFFEDRPAHRFYESALSMTLLSLIKMLHLMGVIMGFGGAVFADLTVLRGAILNPIRQQTITMARTLSHLVFAGLSILWVSGIALVCIRASTDSHALMNEKLWAKITIVAILTINGIIVHRVALTHLATREGKRLFNANRQGEIARLTFIAAVSSTSWVVPFILGVATEFNFTVGVAEILGCYVWLIMVAWVSMFLLASALLFEEPSSLSTTMERHPHTFGKRPPQQTHAHVEQGHRANSVRSRKDKTSSHRHGRYPDARSGNPSFHLEKSQLGGGQ